MKAPTLAFIGLLLFSSATFAHGGEGGVGGLGGFGRFGFGGHGGGIDDLGGIGFRFFNVDRIQERYDDRLDGLQTKYDDGVADDTDFFSSEAYDRILGRTETLSDSYGLFLSGAERNIDRLTDVISIANDDLTYYNDLLATYQADDSLSAARLARIERSITRITDRLDLRIDALTDQQSTLQTNLPTYQSFQTDISTFLTTITAAGSGGTTDSIDTSTVSVKALTAFATATAEGDTGMCAAGSATLTPPSSVPEPSTTLLALVAAGAMAVVGRRRRRGA